MPALTSLDDADIDLHILETIQSLNRDFFKSLAGEIQPTIFFDSWNAFEKTVASCRDRLRADTKDMVYASAVTIATVASDMLQVESTAKAVSEEVAADIKQILEGGMDTLTIDDNRSGSADIITTTSYPAYIKPSYAWLLKNLHNPYPSKDVRAAISGVTGSSQKDIDSWFIDARKRMGWNALRKARFSNKRSEIIEAATRFFVKEDPKRSLTSDIELEFVSIQTFARELYSEKFLESALATKLDVAVKDMTPEMKAKAKAEEKKRKQLEKDRKMGVRAYPSPERSPGRSPEPLTPPSSDNAELPEITIEASSSRKRRGCSPDVDDSANIERPNKRIRIDTTPFSDGSYIQCLPSPAPSVDGAREMTAESPLSEESPHSLSNTTESPLPVSLPSIPTVPSISASAVPTSTKRKRRLSESDGNSVPKRPCGVPPPAPRLQTVSDPIRTLDWYLQSTPFGELITSEVPTVSVEDLDPETEYDVEVFDYAAQQAQLESTSGSQIFNSSAYTSPVASSVTGQVSYTPVEDFPSNMPTFTVDQYEYYESPVQWSGDHTDNFSPAEAYYSYDSTASSFAQEPVSQGNTHDTVSIADPLLNLFQTDSLNIDSILKDFTTDCFGQNAFSFLADADTEYNFGIGDRKTATGLLLSQPEQASEEEERRRLQLSALQEKKRQLEEELAATKLLEEALIS